ncbi:MAG TPA: enoyl-CoA hydratase/isomerase family protein [Gemmatimonadales bacterium]|jgi:enoyl-CoA hydratase
MLDRSTERGITTIRLAHGKASALDVELVRALDDAFKAVEKDPTAKALVLTGTGSIFCAGVDLFRVVKEGPAYAERFVPPLAAMFLRLFSFPKPVVAAVNGHAIAGGCVMTCAADYRLMADGKGTIGVPELTVGVPFPLVAIEIMRYAVGSGPMQRLAFAGRTYAPAAAQAHGLVDEVVESARLLDQAREIALRLSAEPAQRFRITKQQLREPTRLSIQRHADETDGAVLRAWQDPETIKAIAAYLETLGRRAP